MAFNTKSAGAQEGQTDQGHPFGPEGAAGASHGLSGFGAGAFRRAPDAAAAEKNRLAAAALAGELNDMQKKAALAPAEASALVIAGAGSGKTKVLTSRIAHLIGSAGVAPSAVMAVTFTNKAAKEMLERLRRTGVDSQGLWMGTFHSICGRILRRFPQLSGMPRSFQILDTDDSRAMVKRIWKEKGFDEKKLSSKDACNWILEKKEQGLRCKALAFKRPSEEDKMLLEGYAAYEAELAKQGNADFPELMLRCVEILRESEPLRAWARGTFAHILVDEFQDTNNMQYEWLRLMSSNGEGKVFAVGDDDQSIYAFRGANVGNIRLFMDDFGVGADDVVRLEQNYRSMGNILKAANGLISHNKSRMGKTLWTGREDGEKIRVWEAPTDQEEAQWIAKECYLLAKSGAKLSEVAVLYRANAQSRSIEQAIMKLGLPYTVHGGLRFFERAEIKDALAWLRMARNGRDDAAFMRALAVPARGLGPAFLAKLSEIARDEGLGLLDSCKAYAEQLKGRAAESAKDFLARAARIAKACESGDLKSAAIAAVTESGLLELYGKNEDEAERAENLRELVNAAAGFEADAGYAADEHLSPIDAFLTSASLEAGQRGEQAGSEAIQLMTVHASKGLEFENVFLAGLEDGIFPHSMGGGGEEALEEERRLMYVAVTRAKRRLSISCAAARMVWGKMELFPKSRFLSEIPKALTVRLNGAGSPGRAVLDEWEESRAPAPGAGAGGGAGREVTCANSALLQAGCRVRHAKFGDGTIKSVSGSGEGAVYDIDFGASGRRKLIALHLKLELLS